MPLSATACIIQEKIKGFGIIWLNTIISDILTLAFADRDENFEGDSVEGSDLKLRNFAIRFYSNKFQIIG